MLHYIYTNFFQPKNKDTWEKQHRTWTNVQNLTQA